MVESLDQSTIDQIVAAAEEETPEGKIAKLEKEIELLKGSIKRLLMDIRETLNNLENPFQSLQNLAEVVSPAAKPQQVQILPPPPAPPESVKNEEEVVEEDREKKEELEEVDKNVSPSSIFKEDKSREIVEKDKEVMEKEWIKFKEEMGLLTKIDLATLLNLMEWVSNMLKKYDQETLKKLMDIFEYVGYINPKTKDFIIKVIEVSSAVDGSNLEEVILDLYRLHKIINPNDTSMDSKILLLILNRRLGSGNLNW